MTNTNDNRTTELRTLGDKYGMDNLCEWANSLGICEFAMQKAYSFEDGLYPVAGNVSARIVLGFGRFADSVPGCAGMDNVTFDYKEIGSYGHGFASTDLDEIERAIATFAERGGFATGQLHLAL